MLFQHLQSVPTSLPKYVWKCIFQTWLCSRSKVNNIGKEISYSEFSVFNYYQLMAVTSYMGVSFQLSAVHGHQYVAVLFPRALFLIFKVHLVCFSYWLTSQSWLWRSQLMCSLIQSNIWGYAMLCHSYALSRWNCQEGFCSSCNRGFDWGWVFFAKKHPVIEHHNIR